MENVKLTPKTNFDLKLNFKFDTGIDIRSENFQIEEYCEYDETEINEEANTINKETVDSLNAYTAWLEEKLLNYQNKEVIADQANMEFTTAAKLNEQENE